MSHAAGVTPIPSPTISKRRRIVLGQLDVGG